MFSDLELPKSRWGVRCSRGSLSVRSFAVTSQFWGDDFCPADVMLVTGFNPLSLPYKKPSWVQVDCALDWGLCGWSKDPEGSIPLLLCPVRMCPSFLAEGRWEESDGKSLELGRGKKIRYPFSGMAESSGSINSLWKLRGCFEDLFPPDSAWLSPAQFIRTPLLVFRLIFTIASLSSFSSSAIFSVTLANLTIPSFFYLALTEGWAIFVVKPKGKCLAATLISWLGVLDQVGEDAVYMPHLFWAI